jgi:two-component system nitrogen regulation sensor histidine kinase GlnL
MSNKNGSITKRTVKTVCRAMEYLNSAVICFDRRLRLQYLNPAGEMLLAVSARQAVGSPAAALLPGNKELVEALRRSIASSEPFSKREVLLLFPGREAITVWCMASPIEDAEPDCEFLVEMVRMDHQLRLLREGVLIAQNNASRALLRGLAHEIKNPLGGLRGAAQLLERELEDESLKEYTRIIISEADRLRNLPDKMLGPNRLPRKRLVSIHEALERVRQLVGVEAPPDIRFAIDYDPSIPPVFVDLEQLIQALLNLVRNATQALEGKGTIVLRTRSVRQFSIGPTHHRLVARIDIIDDGPGIPRESLQNIFLPMVTTRPEGVGLGLPLAQSLAHQNGGLIECSSRPGHTVFSMFIPIPSDASSESNDDQTGTPNHTRAE